MFSPIFDYPPHTIRDILALCVDYNTTTNSGRREFLKQTTAIAASVAGSSPTSLGQALATTASNTGTAPLGLIGLFGQLLSSLDNDFLSQIAPILDALNEIVYQSERVELYPDGFTLPEDTIPLPLRLARSQELLADYTEKYKLLLEQNHKLVAEYTQKAITNFRSNQYDSLRALLTEIYPEYQQAPNEESAQMLLIKRLDLTKDEEVARCLIKFWRTETMDMDSTKICGHLTKHLSKLKDIHSVLWKAKQENLSVQNLIPLFLRHIVDNHLLLINTGRDEYFRDLAEYIKQWQTILKSQMQDVDKEAPELINHFNRILQIRRQLELTLKQAPDAIQNYWGEEAKKIYSRSSAEDNILGLNNFTKTISKIEEDLHAFKVKLASSKYSKLSPNSQAYLDSIEICREEVEANLKMVSESQKRYHRQTQTLFFQLNEAKRKPITPGQRIWH